MCLQCHQGLTDEQFLFQIQDPNPQFEKWSWIFASNMSFIALGANGPECSAAALDILERYSTWKSNHRKPNDNTYMGQPENLRVSNQIRAIKNFRELAETNNVSYEDIKHMVISREMTDEQRDIFGDLRRYSVPMRGSFNGVGTSKRSNNNSICSLL